MFLILHKWSCSLYLRAPSGVENTVFRPYFPPQSWIIIFPSTGKYYAPHLPTFRWSSFIYSFFSTRPFNQKLGSSLIYFFRLDTTSWQQYMILSHLFFLLRSTIRPKIRVHTDLLLHLCTTIRPKFMVLINLFILFVHDHSTKN